MRTSVTVALVAVLLAVASTRSRAEDVVAYQAEGDADAGAADARIAALDEAFGKAVSQALNDLVDAGVRRQHKQVLDRELIGHARLWVTKFTVTRETVADDRKQVTASVRVDRDKLRARLGELNVPLRPGASEAAPSTEPAVVLLRVAAPEGVKATYGLSAEADVPGLAALSGVLRRANLAIKRAPATGPAATADGELPLDDATAEALAADAKATVACVAGVTTGPPVPLRGVDASGVLVSAHVRLFDRKARKPLGQGTVVAASRGSDPGVVAYAIDRAVAAAASDALPRPATQLVQAPAVATSDPPIGEPGIVLVRLPRATPWSLVQAELKHLVGARGVTSATLRHVSPAGWVIGVASAESIDRIASLAKRAPTADTQVQVKVVGEIVEVVLSSTVSP